ncbi:MAG: fused MFS/spermidine synthase [Actinobacteria bacterium]|nr:fused MFS/spermidine synthase [Actinomycetota bacterium]
MRGDEREPALGAGSGRSKPRTWGRRARRGGRPVTIRPGASRPRAPVRGFRGRHRARLLLLGGSARDRDTRRTLGSGLSAAATAGALLGTFLTGFVLVAALPTRPIVVGLGIALIVVGAVLWMALTKTSPLLAISASLIATAVAFVAPQPCEHETAYYCVTVTADPQRSSGRVLTLDNLRHSYVDLEDPLFLEFRYTRLLAGVVDATYGNRSLDALHIGGGGFTLPRWLAARHPGSSSTVLELDPSLVEIDRSELGLQLGRDLRVRTGDARMSIAGEPAGRYDAVIGDAFGGLAVPWHLTTIEMIREIKRTMRPGAVYALNMIDGGPRNLVRAELATLASVFNHVAVVVPPDGGLVGNYVLVASDAPIRVGAVPAADGTPIVDDAGVAAFIADAQPLRDDFAPVDQLITRR